MSQREDPGQLLQRKKLPVKLVFDTAASNHAAGVRRREATSRHLLFEVENLCLDLRLDTGSQSDSAVLVGQLADRLDPLKPFAGLPVLLVAGEDCLAQTISNRLGEFQIEYEPNKVLKICLPIDEDRMIEVPMNP